MSRYDKKQGLDGIATLTNNPLALNNIRKEGEITGTRGITKKILKQWSKK